MNFLHLTIRLALILLVLIVTDLRALPPAEKLVTNGETATIWPGVKLVVGEIKRLDQDHILIAVRVTSDATAPYQTFIGTPPAVDAEKIKHANSAELRLPDYNPSPYSLASSTLIDQQSQKQFTASASVPHRPFLGMNALIMTLYPSSWIQMAVQFPLPAPPPNPDGTLPVQKVDLSFPKATGQIKGVVVPPFLKQQ